MCVCVSAVECAFWILLAFVCCGLVSRYDFGGSFLNMTIFSLLLCSCIWRQIFG